jgi:hypothetical protein
MKIRKVRLWRFAFQDCINAVNYLTSSESKAAHISVSNDRKSFLLITRDFRLVMKHAKLTII